jgi:hypothetical protein
MFVGFSVLGLLYVKLKPEGRAVHRELVEQMFNLPEGVEFAAFRSGYGRHSPGGVEAIIQFTPGQYLAFYDSLRDPSAWTLEPFSLDDMEVTARPQSGAMTWHDAEWDVITERQPHQVARWVDWGFAHGREYEGKTSLWDIERKKSLCFAVNGQGTEQQIRPCTDLVDERRPELFVRAMLDRDGKRLFVYMRG